MKKDKTEVVSKSSTEKKKPVVKTEAKKSAKPDKVKKPSKMAKFFKDLKSEVKKIVWPTKKTVLNNTGVVLIAMVFVGLLIYGVDQGFFYLFQLILKRS